MKPTHSSPSSSPSPDEEDFMSDAFLQGINGSTEGRETVTYSEKRRREINAAREKGKTKSRVEREREAREQGLRRNLLESSNGRNNEDEQGEDVAARTRKRKDEEDAEFFGVTPSNKALKMMLSMGYRHGQGLGKPKGEEQQRAGHEVDEDTQSNVTKDEYSPAAMTVPLTIDERWLGPKARAGIGRMSTQSAQALSLDIAEAITANSQRKMDKNTEDAFRQRAREEHSLRHWEKLLVNARSTCEDLDRRLGVQFSPLWLNPESLSKSADQLPAHIAKLNDYAFEGLEDAEIEDASNREDAVARAKESKQFCMLPAKVRLDITLSHLRRAHEYCIYCGLQYDSQEQLHEQCPGEDEDDH